MQREERVLILEIIRQDNQLSMSLFAQDEHISTVRSFSQCQFPLTETKQLSQEVVYAFNQVHQNNPELLAGLKKTGQLLWNSLLTNPVKQRLRDVSGGCLILFLDESLIDIPWEFFYDGKDYLCLKFSIGRLVRSKDRCSRLHYRSPGEVLKMLILANPTNDLASAYLEGRFIRNLLDRRRKDIRVDFRSTKIDILSVKKNFSEYDIVHFAGHCENAKNHQTGYGWVFNDGILSARDIFLLGEDAIFPSLIFSNACHSSGIEKGLIEVDYQRRAFDFAGAFLLSGVRHYLGGIWKLADTASLVFAREFYTHLINGVPIGESVRQGRMILVREYGIKSLFWTGYLLYGDPGFVFFRRHPPGFKLKHKLNLAFPVNKKIIILLLMALTLIFSPLFLRLASRQINTQLLYSKSRRLFSQGSNQQAIGLTQQMLEKDKSFLAAYPLLAQGYQRLGDRKGALKTYFEYILAAQKRHDFWHENAGYIGIGWLYQLSGEYAKAVDFYNRALNLARQNRDKLHEAIALRKIAVWYIDREDYDHALEFLTRSCAINQQESSQEHRYNLACDNFDLGLVFASKGDFVLARDFYDKSRQIFEQMKLTDELSDYYFNLGEIYLFEKAYQKTLDSYLCGLAIDRKLGNLPAMVADYEMIGELYLEMGDLDNSEKYFQEALALAGRIDAWPELSSVYCNLALLAKQRNDPVKTKEYFSLAKQSYERLNLPLPEKIRDQISREE